VQEWLSHSGSSGTSDARSLGPCMPTEILSRRSSSSRVGSEDGEEVWLDAVGAEGGEGGDGLMPLQFVSCSGGKLVASPAAAPGGCIVPRVSDEGIPLPPAPAAAAFSRRSVTSDSGKRSSSNAPVSSGLVNTRGDNTSPSSSTRHILQGGSSSSADGGGSSVVRGCTLGHVMVQLLALLLLLAAVSTWLVLTGHLPDPN
jgi:hypothetical protein